MSLRVTSNSLWGIQITTTITLNRPNRSLHALPNGECVDIQVDCILSFEIKLQYSWLYSSWWQHWTTEETLRSQSQRICLNKYRPRTWRTCNVDNLEYQNWATLCVTWYLNVKPYPYFWVGRTTIFEWFHHLFWLNNATSIPKKIEEVKSSRILLKYGRRTFLSVWGYSKITFWWLNPYFWWSPTHPPSHSTRIWTSDCFGKTSARTAVGPQRTEGPKRGKWEVKTDLNRFLHAIGVPKKYVERIQKSFFQAVIDEVPPVSIWGVL